MIAVESLHLQQGRFSLSDVNFTVAAGEYVVLMGQTGTGKTSLLETICGLRQPDSGVVRINGVDVTRLPPWGRGVSYVPQDRALFNTMSVRDNIGFALRVRRLGEAATQRRVEELAGFMGIGHLLDRSPVRLSGGEAGRVALARALAPSPTALLLDEPLAALDEVTAGQMVELIKRLRLELRATVMHVTHRRVEADQLADRILTMSDGRVREMIASSKFSAEVVSRESV